MSDAKIALGERGEPWWEPPSEHGLANRAAATVRALLRHRRPDSSICPSDVARVVGRESWRSTMPAVRDVITAMADAGTVTVTQRGETVDLRKARGPVRVRRGPTFG